MSRELSITWAKVACIATIAAGLVAVAASTPATSEPWRFLFDLLTWPIDGSPAAFLHETSAVNAVLGGTMAGWGTLMYLIVTGPIAHGDTQPIKPLLVSLTVWFLVDSGGSLLAGIPLNIVLNLGFLALFLPPLLSLMQDHHVES